MPRQILLVVMLLVAAGVGLQADGGASEQKTRSGQIYATVKMLPDGDLEVISLASDLPERLNPEIEAWLKEQAIEFAATPEAEPPNRTTVQVDYSIIEDGQGGRGLVLMVKGTGVSAPEHVASPVSLVEREIPVKVTVRSDGSVADVNTVSELPEGMRQEDIETAVRKDIENDADIQQAAREGRLREQEYDITVRVQTSDN